LKFLHHLQQARSGTSEAGTSAIRIERGARVRRQNNMVMKRDLRAVEFGSNRLSLRSFVPDDAPAIFPSATAAIARFMVWEPTPSLAAFSEVTRPWVPRMQAGTDAYLVARLAGDFTGVVGLHRIGGAEPEIGVWIRQESHGRGFGREAVAAMIAWATERLGAAAFIYPVAAENQPSRRLAESLGGTLVGHGELRKPSGVVLPKVVYRIPAAVPREG
jgi:RimJ/RimL family protein N-acetyltransferase